MSYSFSFLFPWLLASWVLAALAKRQKVFLAGSAGISTKRERLLYAGAAIISVFLVLLPLRAIPLGRWVVGLNFSPSIPLLCFLADHLVKGFTGNELFAGKDRMAGWIFGALAGSILYPLSMGLGSFDPYALGWGWTALFPIVAVLTIFLIWKQNRVGFALLLSIVAYDLHCLESPNFWDYLIDPLYWLVGLAFLAKSALSRLGHRKANVVPECSPAKTT